MLIAITFVEKSIVVPVIKLSVMDMLDSKRNGITDIKSEDCFALASAVQSFSFSK